MPKTLVREVSKSLDDALCLDSQDGVREALDKGLYQAPREQPVVIREGDEVIALESAGRLREDVLPRSWQAPIKDWITMLPAPAEVSEDTQVAELAFLVQHQRRLTWVLVVEGESGNPVGTLDRAAILRYLPPLDTTVEAYRDASLRLWGDSTVKHYYYCPVEKKTYGPHAVRPDAQGRMRDRKGHLVEKRALPQ
jgi:hypothetical protein